METEALTVACGESCERRGTIPMISVFPVGGQVLEGVRVRDRLLGRRYGGARRGFGGSADGRV